MVCDLVSESHRSTSSRNILPLQKSKSGRLSENPSSFEKGVSPHFLYSVAPTNPAVTNTSYKTQWRRLQTHHNAKGTTADDRQTRTPPHNQNQNTTKYKAKKKEKVTTWIRKHEREALRLLLMQEKPSPEVVSSERVWFLSGESVAKSVTNKSQDFIYLQWSELGALIQTHHHKAQPLDPITVRQPKSIKCPCQLIDTRI